MGNNLAQRVGQQVDQRQPQGDTLESKIRSMEGQFQLAMPRGAEASQLVRDGITVLRQNPKLAQAEPMSFFGALMQCAQLGLRPGIGALGQAHILPFWNSRARRFDAQFIIGYQGMLELANRSGDIDYINAEMVCANDEFVPDPMGGRHQHKYPISGPRGVVVGYYSIFYRKGAERGQLFYMSKEDMEAHRDQHAKARNKNGQVVGPWVDHFDAMALKTTLRLNFKYMPKSTQIEQALVADESVRVDLTPTDDLYAVSDHGAGVPAQLQGEFEPEANRETGEVIDQPAGGDPTPEELEQILANEAAGR
ncbi:recombinase RecT [Zhihengliuella halotolerans]|uniref:recombinase RecT n=1 Tax=Zhihengliuella halotolerans TaxID=370736 RepID=UPI000C808AC0|nr:recombinase RecT [Zhihengliuella halotolerans]